MRQDQLFVMYWAAKVRIAERIDPRYHVDWKRFEMRPRWRGWASSMVRAGA